MSTVPEENLVLGDLRPGERAKVVGFRAHSDYVARLMQLGLIPGTEFSVVRRAPLGDPIEIRFRGFALVLRPMEAQALVLGPAA